MENVVEEAALAYNQKYTPEEYLNMEWENGQRYEYWDGELVAMSFATLGHNRIAANINRKFQDKKDADNCGSFQESVMLRQENNYFLPDVMLTCHPDDLDPTGFQIKHPTIIVEVLSKSTEIYDRTQKWDEYRKIKSLRHYILVNQYELKVEMFSRANEHALFYYQSFEGFDQVITFDDLGFKLSLNEIYEGISFTSEVKT